MIKRKRNKKNFNDQKETEKKKLSMIKGKENKKTINGQKETGHENYQWSKGNRTQRLSMVKRKRVLFPFNH
jgi:hypothetical protein